MADIALGDLVVTSLSIEPWTPEQGALVAPYRPAEYPAGPDAAGWQGSVGLAPKTAGDPAMQDARDRELLALAGRTRGLRHRVRLPVSSHYLSSPPPADEQTDMTRAVLGEESVDVVYAAQNWGDWRPDVGSYLSIGDRLYLLDALDHADTTMTLIPGALPRAAYRPNGIFQVPGGAAPETGLSRTLQSGDGLAVWRGSLYEAYFGPGRSHVYWTDPYTGSRREVLVMQHVAVDSLFSAGDVLYASGRVGAARTIYRLDLPFADPARNSFEPVLTLTGVPSGGNQRITGLAEWSAPGSRDFHVYLAVNGDTAVYRLTAPLPGRDTTDTWANRTEAVAGLTTSGNVGGMSVGPFGDGRLYVLDAGANRIYTWDGLSRVEYARDYVFATASANGIRVTGCRSIEWFHGMLLVQNQPVGTTNAGLARIGVDPQANLGRIRFGGTGRGKQPFLWVRLRPGPVGPVGAGFPGVTWSWVEAPRL